MPSVDVAMLNSLRPSAWETVKTILARGISTGLIRRDMLTDAQGHVTDVKTAFSSWDNCMQASFCKWPVIAVIIIGGLIIFSILWCIVRCAMCGVSCCCSCFHCLKCCGDCCGCCDPPKGSQHKYLDAPYVPPHHAAGGGYHGEAPMQAQFPPPSTRSQPPQYAEFDVSRKGNEDALPQMPGWDTAASKKVEIEEEEHEMNELKSPHPDQKEPLAYGGQSGLSSPMPSPLLHSPMNRGSPSPSPSLYGQSRPGPGGYMQTRNQPISPSPLSPHDAYYNQGGRSFPNNRESVGFGLDEPYDTVPDASTMPDPAQVAAYSLHTQNYAAQSQGQNQNQNYNQNQSQMGQHSAIQSHTEQEPIEMPAEPIRHSNGSNFVQGQPQSPTELPTSPVGYGLRRQGTGENARNSPAPPGIDPRMRNSPGPGGYGPNGGPGGRRGPGTPGPREPPFGQSPRQSPALSQNGFGYGPPPGRGQMDRSYSPGPGRGMRDQVDRTYSPAPNRPPRDQVQRTYSPIPPPASQGYPHGRPDRNYSPAPGMSPGRAPARQFSPAPPRQFPQQPERQGTPDRQHRQMPDRNFSSAPTPSFAQEQDAPPSPLTNNSGFDFSTSSTRPTTQPVDDPSSGSAYPGHQPYRAV